MQCMHAYIHIYTVCLWKGDRVEVCIETVSVCMHAYIHIDTDCLWDDSFEVCLETVCMCVCVYVCTCSHAYIHINAATVWWFMIMITYTHTHTHTHTHGSWWFMIMITYTHTHTHTHTHTWFVMVHDHDNLIKHTHTHTYIQSLPDCLIPCTEPCICLTHIYSYTHTSISWKPAYIGCILVLKLTMTHRVSAGLAHFLHKAIHFFSYITHGSMRTAIQIRRICVSQFTCICMCIPLTDQCGLAAAQTIFFYICKIP